MAAPLAPLARLAPMSLKMPENADARSLLETFGLSAKFQYFESGLEETFFLLPLLMSTITSRSRVSDSNNSSCASSFPGLPEVAYTRALGVISLDLVVWDKSREFELRDLNEWEIISKLNNIINMITMG
jgi:hypothetical protein